MKIATAIAILLFATNIWAHEGHDKSPGVVAAPHGGIVQGTRDAYVELVSKADGIQIYLYNHDMKPLDMSTAKIEGTARLPKKNKGDAVTFTQESGAWIGKIDAKGAHRYTLELSITVSGKKDKTKFTVEPQ